MTRKFLRFPLAEKADIIPRRLADVVPAADLGIAKTYSRPHTSNDNPYSESQFRTLKYHPEFPDRFGCLEDARINANATLLFRV